MDGLIEWYAIVARHGRRSGLSAVLHPLHSVSLLFLP